VIETEKKGGNINDGRQGGLGAFNWTNLSMRMKKKG